jgi:competence ComEA-like helix-hairpin-helix protein
VTLYSRQQLLVLLGLLVTFGGGLAVDRWRRVHPEIVERVERFDREEAPAASDDEGRQRAAPPRPVKLPSVPGSPGIAPIDLNLATADELTRLPGVGPALAARILEARAAEPFTSVEDLRRVRGVGKSKLERMRPLVTVNPP